MTTTELVEAPMRLYGEALRRAEQGEPALLRLVGPQGEALGQVDAAQWTGRARPGDGSVLDRCRDATLDVGCGPGRLTAALHRRGHIALGVDICTEAVRQARRQGAWAMRADVFTPLPWEGRWNSVLLADGNIGIGGDPARLLRRCVSLLGRRGRVVVEVHPPGAESWAGPVALHHGDRRSAPFPWARVGVRDTSQLAQRAGLRVVEQWTEARRWFVRFEA